MPGKWKSVLLLLILIPLLCACPKKQIVVSDNDSTSAQPSGVTGEAAPAGASGSTESSPMPPDSDADANPMPTGDNWVYAPKLAFASGDSIDVQYHMSGSNDNKAWIGLVPSATTVTDESSNDAAAVARAEIVALPDGSVQLVTTQEGSFVLRFFAGNMADSALLGESPVITIGPAAAADSGSAPDAASSSAGAAPALTLANAGGATLSVRQGEVVSVHFSVPSAYGQEAWIGVIPVGITSVSAGDNRAGAVASMKLGGQTDGSYAWVSDQSGDFLFRLFPDQQAGSVSAAESMSFTVTP